MKKKSLPPEADLRSAYLQAERFRFAEEHLRIKLSESENPMLGAYLVLPSMVLCAFACELYLKCLTLLEGGTPLPTHNLKKLFKSLPGKTQKELEQVWLADEPTQNTIEKISNATGVPLPNDLRSALEQGGTAFDYLRYAHQKDPNQTNFFLGNLPRLLRQTIHKRRPEWLTLGPRFGPLTTSQTR